MEQDSSSSIADDIVYHVEPIGQFWGCRDTRQAYYLIQIGVIPTFKMGRHTCASKRAMREKYADLQKQAVGAA